MVLLGLTTDENVLRHTRFSCWVPKATNTHSEYVIVIALPLQQWLEEAPQCYVTLILPFFVSEF